jgi:hypothetical protein
MHDNQKAQPPVVIPFVSRTAASNNPKDGSVTAFTDIEVWEWS